MRRDGVNARLAARHGLAPATSLRITRATGSRRRLPVVEQGHPLQDIKKRLAKASLWVSVSRALTSSLTALSTIVLARILMPSDFGLVALATTLMAVLNAITEISMTSALVHLRDPDEDHYHTAWTLNAARGLVLAIGFALLAGPMARLYDEPRLVAVMYALTATILINGLANPRLIMLQKKLVFRQVFVVNVSQGLVTVVGSIALAFILGSYWALVLGMIAGQATALFVSYLLFPFRPRFSWRHTRQLWSFSFWLSLGQVVNTVNFRFDHLLIGGYLGRAALGHYSVGSNLAVVPAREAVMPLTQTLFPAFSLVADNLARLRRGYQRAQATVAAIALPAGIGFALVADPLIRLTMGDKWAPAILVVQAISALYAIQALGRLAHPLAMAKGETRLLFNRSLVIFLIRLPLVAAGMYFWSLPGIVLGRVIAGILGMLINLHMVRSLIGLSIGEQLRQNLRCFAGLLTLIGAAIGVQLLLPAPAGPAGYLAAIFVPALAGAVAYVGTLWLLWYAAGRPQGPESDVLELARKVLARIGGNRSRTEAAAD